MKKISIIFLIVLFLGGFNYLKGNYIKSSLLGWVLGPSRFITEKIFEIKIFWIYLARYSSITEENAALLAQNSALLVEKQELLSIRDENEQLRNQISVAPKKEHRLEQVSFFLNSADFSGNLILIDKGRDFGISKGQAVIYGGNILIGIVKEVYETTAGIMALGDPGLKLSVKTLNGTVALARGDGISGKVMLDFVGLDNNIIEGEPIFTGGTYGIPKNLLVGYIEKSEINGGGLFRTVRIGPAYKELNLINAFVLKTE